MVQSAITLRHYISECTNFRGRESQKLPRFIFASAPKNYVLLVLIFVESSKCAKSQNFIHAKIWLCKVRLLTSMDRKIVHHRQDGSPASSP